MIHDCRATARPVESEHVKLVVDGNAPRGQGTPNVAPVVNEALLPSQLIGTASVVEPDSFIFANEKGSGEWNAKECGSIEN